VAGVRPDACALANNHLPDYRPRGTGGCRTPWTRCPVPGCGRWAPGRDAGEARRPAAVPVPGGGRVVIFSSGTGSSGIPAGWAAARAGPASISCPICPARPPMTSSAGRGRRSGPGMSWSSPSTGIEVGLCRWPGSGPLRAPADRRRRRSHPRSFLAPPLIRSRCSGASWSCTAVGTASTTTRALPAMSGTGVTCGCCTSRRCSRARARQRPCGWRPCRPGDCGCTAPRRRTPGGWGR